MTTAAAVALGLALTSGGVAGATSPSHAAPSSHAAPGGERQTGGSPPVAVGKVRTVGTDTFTLTTEDETSVTVTVTPSTTYHDKSVTTPTVANVTVGEQVAVFGTDVSNTVTATAVAIGIPPGAGGRGGPGRMGGPLGAEGMGTSGGRPPRAQSSSPA